jgi:branched-subunit amino acid aminotransferase/4-amino-4-deoxychorismate lyase
MQKQPTNRPPPLRAWIDSGAGFEPANAVPIADRGFRYGMSVFESFPLRDGVADFLEHHLRRLRVACELTGLTPPSAALTACEALLQQATDGFARIYVTAGDGTVTGDFDACRVLVMVEAREPTPARVYHRGYDLGLHGGNHVPLFPGLKTGNYWANLRAFREGVAAHCNETLLFTPEGFLISACMANAFLVKDGRIRTPVLTTGARPGVIREWVMARTDVTEALLTRADVESADEIFLTSSWLGIMPAASIAGHPLPNREVAQSLLAAYREAVDRS